MSDTFHLVVEVGEEKGKLIAVPPGGARVGRSSKNDIVLPDPMLSRHHCRIYFKTGDGLWVSDLGSVNQTLVNGEPVSDAPLLTGSTIEIGETVLRALNDGRTPSASHEPVVDLGLRTANETSDGTGEKRQPLGTHKLIFIALLVFLAIGGMYGVKWWHGRPAPVQEVPPPPPKDWTLSIDYEKVDASTDNIFRYHLRLAPDGVLSIDLDDLQNNKSLSRSVQVADPELLRQFAEFVEQNGFFALAPEYANTQQGLMESKALSITIGHRTHHVLVQNHMEPRNFEAIRTRLEDFGTTELKMWAVPYSAEKLTEMAMDKLLLGQKMFNERGFQVGNLYKAVKAYNEGIWFLETVADKPDFQRDLIAGLREAEEELQARYVEQNFRAVQAMQTGDWAGAVRELSIIIEMIPDRSDQRHKDAERQLMDADRRVRLQQR